MTDPVVHTATGPVRGRIHSGVAAFKGIPYAAPTDGAGRFAPPRPPEPWTEPLDAGAFGVAAPQNPSLLEQMLDSGELSVGEDCLTLNVFAPETADGSLPVMVWIHGGGFLTGTSSMPWYDGTRYAQRGVVVVSINYRLGVFGFLHLEEIDPAFEGSGNAGILDQVAALEWVQANIASFGGDPDQVTIFGESAGAMGVTTLLAVPAAKGLFKRAIMQSGAGAHFSTAEVATTRARKFLAEVGVDPGDLAALRAMPLSELLEAQARFTAAFPFEAGLPLQPVVDGRVLPTEPLVGIASGSAAEVEVLVGTNAEEMKMFLLLEPSLAQMDQTSLSAKADEVMTGPEQFGGPDYSPGDAARVYGADRGDQSLPDVLSAILTDHTFRIPAIRLAEAQLNVSESVWMYEFAYRTPVLGGILGCCHALDIPFVWDNLDTPGAVVFAGEATQEMRDLAAAMADAWTTFAKSGSPSDALSEWPRYDLGRRATMQFDVIGNDQSGGIRLLDDPAADERRLWH